MFANRNAIIRVGCMLLLCVLALFLDACNCDEVIDFKAPMSIRFLEPTGTVILEGRVRARVEDANGIESVTVLVNGKEVAKKDVGGEAEYTITATFDLDTMPEEFEIKVVGLDITQVSAEETLNVRKDQGVPQLRFVSPDKLDPKHEKIFVGKSFKTVVEAKDRDGIKEIAITMVPSGVSEEPVKTCALNTTDDNWAPCEVTLNLSDKKYVDGDLVLQATATDGKGRTPDRKTRLQVVLDKTGPIIQFQTPAEDQRLKGGEEMRVIIRDQVGVKRVEMYVDSTQLNVQVDSAKADNYFAIIDKSALKGSNPVLKVVAYDALDNKSELTRQTRGGCSTDADCEAGMRCCTGGTNSPANKEGKFTGRCFKVQDKEGALCDPCTNPCGKGADGQLMGCLPGACERPPFKCRPACNLGNPNLRPDKCRPADPNANPPRGAEYCARSDITRINSSLGSCAEGDDCDPINQKVCQPGALPPYRGCCPSGFGCYPADDDANICIPEGSTQPRGENCELRNCQGGKNCTAGYLCTVSVDQQGRPIGNSSCNPMCQCGAACRAGLPTACPGGGFCAPVRLTNGNVPLPVGVCVNP